MQSRYDRMTRATECGQFKPISDSIADGQNRVKSFCPWSAAGHLQYRLAYDVLRQPPTISFSPSTTVASSSSDTRASRRPIRSVASVRIWLILIHERFGNALALDSSVNGNPARGGWLVSAIAITVPDRSLNTS